MRRTSIPRHLVAALVIGSFLVSGCGGDDGDDDRTVPAADRGPESGGAAGGGDASSSGVVDAIGGAGSGETLEGLSMESIGSALVSATGADRFEIEGDVLHLYMGDDSRVPEGGECMVVTALLSAGDEAVVHLADGSEVSCS